MGMNDDRLNIVERDAPLFLAIKADDEKSAISGQMEVICGNIDNTVHGQPFGSAGWHIMDNDWLTRHGIEDTPEDRKSVVEGKSVSVRVDLGGRRIIKKKIQDKT